VADAALVIEAVDITDAERQQMFTHLIDDFGVSWEQLNNRYTDQIRPKRLDPTDWHRAYHAATAAEAEVNRLASALEEASRGEAARIRRQILSLQETAHECREAAAALRESQQKDAARTPAEQDAIWQRFQRDADALQAQLIENARQLLSPEEWPAFHGFITSLDRRRHLLQASLEGEGLNLDTVINRLLPPLTPVERGQIEPALARWRVAIDAALAVRNALNPPQLHHTAALVAAGRVAEVFRHKLAQLDAARAVRDCTLAHLAHVQAALDADTGTQFRQAAMQAGYPRTFHKTDIEMAIAWCGADEPSDAALLAPLFDEHRAAIAGIRDEGRAALLANDGLGELRRLAYMHQLQQDELAHIAGRAATVNARIKHEMQKAYLELQGLVGRTRASTAFRRGKWLARNAGNLRLHQ
jgi:hypothetical protein